MRLCDLFQHFASSVKSNCEKFGWKLKLSPKKHSFTVKFILCQISIK